MPFHPRRLPAALAAIVFLGSQAFAQSPGKTSSGAPVLTKAAEIARYPSADPAKQPPVELEAIVTFVDPGNTVFLRDETGSTFIHAPRQRFAAFRPGQLLKIRGTRFPGLYIGGVSPREITVVSMGPAPSPLAVTLRDLESARHHYDFVEIGGIGRSFERTGESTAILRMNVEGGILEVHFDQAPDQGDAYIDAGIRVRGLAAGAINDHRQLVYPYLRAVDAGSVTVIDPPPPSPFDAPLTPVSSLPASARSAAPSHRVKISGTALGPAMGNQLFVRSADRGILARVTDPLQVRAGDEVEVAGFPEMGNFSAILADASARVTSTGTSAPAPVEMTPKDLASGSRDSDLVSLEAVILQRSEAGRTFVAKVANLSVEIRSPGGPLPDFAPGSRARFTGLCLVTDVSYAKYRASATGYELWLRDPADAVLLSSPPWWNAGKLSITLGIVAAAGSLALAWAALLKRQVSRQVKVIEAKAQKEAITEERQRIAREFHDTLEQELAGLSIRLDAAVPRVADEKARSLLDQLRKLLFRLQSETRDFVWDLRDESQQESFFTISLEKLLDHLQIITPIPLRLDTSENLPPIPALARHHLLRLCREAVNNAIKYSGARSILVSLQPAEGGITLKVEDDGRGFDVATRSKAEGHFGLQGMRERARKIGATLDLASIPGEGTRLEVRLAIPAA